MIIAIIGPDGCGKTTIALELIKRELELGKKIKLNEMNYNILPKLREFINPFLKKKIKNNQTPGDYLSGMKIKPVSQIRGSLILVWYTLDYILGYLLFKISRKYNKLIFTRYFYDYYFQRSYRNVPFFLIRFCEFFIKKPDKIFTINRKAEDIFKDKPELSVKEIKFQQAKISELFSKTNTHYEIDGSMGVKKTLQNILKHINE